MPLKKSGSEKAFKTNVKEMIKAGHPQNQALAAAYATKAKAQGKKHLAEGGEVDDIEEESLTPEDEDSEAVMDHCALECMRAIELKDKDQFRMSFHVLVGDILHKLALEVGMMEKAHKAEKKKDKEK